MLSFLTSFVAFNNVSFWKWVLSGMLVCQDKLSFVKRVVYTVHKKLCRRRSVLGFPLLKSMWVLDGNESLLI